MNKSSKSKAKFSQASNHCKKVLEGAKLAYAMKTKEYITSQKLGSWDFWQIANKVNLLYLLYSMGQRCFLLHLMKQNYLLKNFLRALILITMVSVYLSRTNLKLHNISITPKMVKKVIMNLDSWKTSGPDCIPVMVPMWHRGVVVINTAQLHSTKPELRFYTGSNPARGMSKICDGEDLWQWSRLEIRLNAFHQSTIPQKQFIIIIIIIIMVLKNCEAELSYTPVELFKISLKLSQNKPCLSLVKLRFCSF